MTLEEKKMNEHYLCRIPEWIRMTHNPCVFKDNTLSKSPVWLALYDEASRRVPGLLQMVYDECMAFGIAAEDIVVTGSCIQAWLRFDSKKQLVVFRPLMAHLGRCVRYKWAGLGDTTLQSTILGLLKDDGYRFKASLHMAERRGARSTLDLLETIDKVWT